MVKLNSGRRILARAWLALLLPTALAFSPMNRPEPRPWWEPAAAAAAAAYGLNTDLVMAVIWAESEGQPRHVSPVGAVGMMQLMPETAVQVGCKDRYNAVQNINGGCQYLRWCLDLFHGDLQLALAAYNAGPTPVWQAGNRIPPYPETRAFVAKVLKLRGER